MHITVVGCGHVGLSNAAVLARHHTVCAVDIDPARVQALQSGCSPIAEPELASALARHLRRRPMPALQATLDLPAALGGADHVLICTPTDYDPQRQGFNTDSVEAVLAQIAQHRPQACAVIKSTVPVGFTQAMRARHPALEILFSPEFLREGHSLHDNLHPDRIVVGGPGPRAHSFAQLMRQASDTPDVPLVLTGSSEAEAIKLFANTWLALRVAFFNELDTFAAMQGLDTRAIIEGVGLDARIGTHYNNPSFGYGGYCLPKDTLQLQASYTGVPQDLIRAVVQANDTRKDFIATQILQRQPRTVGIYRLVMKAGSQNHRNSSVLGIIERLLARGVTVLLHEPLFSPDPATQTLLQPCELVADLQDFKQRSDCIVANRCSDELLDVMDKVYTRDLYARDT